MTRRCMPDIVGYLYTLYSAASAVRIDIIRTRQNFARFASTYRLCEYTQVHEALLWSLALACNVGLSMIYFPQIFLLTRVVRVRLVMWAGRRLGSILMRYWPQVSARETLAMVHCAREQLVRPYLTTVTIINRPIRHTVCLACHIIMEVWRSRFSLLKQFAK